MGLLSLIKKEKAELKPYFEKKRNPCPFYGFHILLGNLIDQDGNRCALITTSYSPCQMEVAKKTPEWNKCPFNTEENRNKLVNNLKNAQTFPKEFKHGIKFSDWAEYILKNK